MVPLTSYAGSERSPSFSPDGNQVAFSWNGEKQDNFDIYVKLIGSPTPVRLTTDPADDVSPAFSPDGRSIGFVRVSKERATFIIIPAIGGPERIVAEVPAPTSHFVEPSFAWLPDGKWVVTDGLALLSTESGETRSLTSPPTKSSPDFSPAVSPDGRTVAFSRSASYVVSDIYLLDLTEDLKPKGEPRRLTSLKGFSFGSAWTPNGREIIFASGFFGSGDEPLEGTGFRLPGNRSSYHLVLERLPAQPSPGAATGWRTSGRCLTPTYGVFRCRAREWPAAPQLGSLPPHAGIRLHNTLPTASGLPLNPTAVESMASGSAMRTAPTPWNCFHRRARVAGPPRWSPDGQRIAFDSNAEGNIDIYVIRASGGKPIRLTTDSADDDGPELVERWQVDLLCIETDRSIRGVEGIGRRRGGCPGDPEWRRDGLRVTRRQVHLLHERRLFRRSLEDAGEWRRGEPGAPVCGLARFLSRQRWDLFHSGAGRRWEVFHPVSELRHRQGENGRSDVRTTS